MVVPATHGTGTKAFRGKYIAVLWNADASESVDDFEATLRAGLAGASRSDKFKYFGARVLVSIPPRKGIRKPRRAHWWAVLVQFEQKVSRTGRWLELPGIGNRIRVSATDIVSSAYIPHWVETPKAQLGDEKLRSWIDSWQCWMSSQAERDQEDEAVVFGERISLRRSGRPRSQVSSSRSASPTRSNENKFELVLKGENRFS